jgi:hypothetical protein
MASPAKVVRRVYDVSALMALLVLYVVLLSVGTVVSGVRSLLSKFRPVAFGRKSKRESSRR